MAETPVKNDVFKFVAIRPPQKRKARDPNPNLVVDPRRPNETPVGKLVAKAGGAQAEIGRVVSLVRQLIARNRWIADTDRAEDVAPIAAVVRLLDKQLLDFVPEDLHGSVKDALGTSPEAFVASEAGDRTREGLWDRLEAFYLLNREEPVDLEELMAGLRALHLVDRLADGEEFGSLADLQAALQATVLLPETLVRLAPAPAADNPRLSERQAREDAEREGLKNLWQRYLELNQAVDEIQMLEPTIEERRERIADEKINIAASENRPGSDDDRNDGAAASYQRPAVAAGAAFLNRRVLRLDAASVDALSPVARAALALTPSDPMRFAKSDALTRLHRDLAFVTSQLFDADTPLLTEMMPAAAEMLPAAMTLKSRNLYSTALSHKDLVSKFPFPGARKAQIRPLGIGDLKVVKQTLERYAAGEVAHIENVLQGESKERKHRRFDRTEDTISTVRETSEETERDTQTTDRFELKKEAEKTIQTDLSAAAGITVSASYGPVELGAYANLAYSESTTDTQKTSSNFARDVVDRSVTRIQKKTREERVTKTIHEVEEINTHGLDNVAGGGHITGVYRWVDKHYKAQIFNYGKRLMLEFVIPEPAAFYVYAQNNNPSKAINVPKPPAIGNVTHKDITESTYQTYIRNYKVQGVTPPPPFTHVLGVAFDQNEMAERQSSSKSSRDLVVPLGYVAKRWAGMWRFTAFLNGASTGMTVIVATYAAATAADTERSLNNEDTVVPIGILTQNIRAYSAVIEVHCERTARHYEEWQIITFEKIMAAYQAATAQYEDKVRAAEARRGVVIAGQNPGYNRVTEHTELKKLSITMLTGERYSTFNATSGSPPEIDLVDATSEGKFVQFFEQAFEWEQMTYLYYPYFWGRKSRWVATSTTFDNDPLFTRFLQAGSARVVVPVHPAYNDAILYYLQTGSLWNGGSPPVIDDPLYIALHEELRAQQDDLDGATAEGTPWQVVLPTSLVWLQPGPELPDFTLP